MKLPNTDKNTIRNPIRINTAYTFNNHVLHMIPCFGRRKSARQRGFSSPNPGILGKSAASAAVTLRCCTSRQKKNRRASFETGGPQSKGWQYE